MAELTQQERLQPSLLDRLVDSEPEQKQESRDQRVLSLRRLREGVLRDLGWLLNCTNLASVQDLDAYPHVADSVLNFGAPALGGITASNFKQIQIEMERRLRQVIASFEPRILKDTLKVRLAVDADLMAHNAVVFEIEGELWAQPVSQRIFLRTEVDLELGAVKVIDFTGARGT
ncbi:MAG TPA: type VI secretion system baseplate subunit TssE [Aliidongia sp.]|uniref:type VI secretion system baseplate subunit TssE n=1 Tax=Aliidongia sp. TaxID=1914230 RepID=UPI002DDD9DA6|nr:type VI secretion system baseplate subunit TssE [Aliidongia sp.]HEV2677048.1 type VI secretion system baseplate subunit TssE [Aliidongia sp.]